MFLFLINMLTTNKTQHTENNPDTMATTTRRRESDEDVTHMNGSSTTALETFMSFLKIKLDMVDQKGKHVGFPFMCDSYHHMFRIEYIEVSHGAGDRPYTVYVYFTVKGTCRDKERVTRFSGKDTQDVIRTLLQMLSSWELCPECVLPNDPEKGCLKCVFTRAVFDHREKEDEQTDDRTCSICLERVMTRPLSCRHCVHPLCMIKMNPFDHFDDFIYTVNEFKCPMCRQKLSLPDIAHIFFLTSECLIKIHECSE